MAKGWSLINVAFISQYLVYDDKGKATQSVIKRQTGKLETHKKFHGFNVQGRAKAYNKNHYNPLLIIIEFKSIFKLPLSKQLQTNIRATISWMR